MVGKSFELGGIVARAPGSPLGRIGKTDRRRRSSPRAPRFGRACRGCCWDFSRRTFPGRETFPGAPSRISAVPWSPTHPRIGGRLLMVPYLWHKRSVVHTHLFAGGVPRIYGCSTGHPPPDICCVQTLSGISQPVSRRVGAGVTRVGPVGLVGRFRGRAPDPQPDCRTCRTISGGCG